jgi:hypothetical protein
MKPVLLLFALLFACPLFAAKATPPIAAYFSPQGGCTEAVVTELGKATKNVYVQAYSFTSAPTAGALVEAHKRAFTSKSFSTRASARKNTRQRILSHMLASRRLSTPSTPSRTTKS